jgi:hypothetical protein
LHERSNIANKRCAHSNTSSITPSAERGCGGLIGEMESNHAETGTEDGVWFTNGPLSPFHLLQITQIRCRGLDIPNAFVYTLPR